MRRCKGVPNRSVSLTYQLRRCDDVLEWSVTSRSIWDLNETSLRRRMTGRHSFLQRRIKVSKTCVGREIFYKTCGGNQNEIAFFILIFSILAIMVTDTAFRKSNLAKLFLGKLVPSTSRNWPYHADFVVFSFEFKLSPICDYLNYYYNITNDFPEKSRYF